MRNYAVIQQALEADLGESQAEFITSDLTISEIRKLMLRKSFYKKLSPNREPTREQTEVAIEKFKSVNSSLPEDFQWVSENESESCFFDYFCDHVNQALSTSDVGGGFGYHDLREYMTSGPGASQQADNRSWHTKVFQSSLTYTNEDLIRVYRTALSDSGSWAEAERQRFEEFGFTKVQGGKLFFVLKNVSEARTCCTEPGLNSIIQQGIRGFLETRLIEYFGINVKTQPAVNRRLCEQGSRDGSFGTIDLSSASDSNGLSLFEKIVRPCFLKRAVLSSRCEVAVLPNGDIENLRMVSTMGNAFTFPLMTILLASAVRACLDLTDPGADYSVFGDDLVVPIRSYHFLIRMLRKLGYLPNDDKSFSSGPFRESCGHDYAYGQFVRGVYIRTLETPQDVYSAFNRLARWSSATEIPLTKTLQILKSMARDYRVPPSEDDLSGFKVPFKLTKPRLSSEYWFNYRCLKRKAKEFVIEEPDSDTGLPCSYLVSALAGVHKHTWITNQTTGELKILKLSSFVRELAGVTPRMKVATKSIPYWDYDKPDSEPGEAWLPGQTPRNLTRYDFDPWRLRIREAPYLWERVLVGAVAN
jgi:hypothetical protein